MRQENTDSLLKKIQGKELDLLNAIKEDKEAADPNKSDWDKKRARWVKESNGEPYGNEEEGKASIVARDIRKAEIWQHATLKDPFVTTPRIVAAFPTGASDEALVNQSESLLNYFFCRNFPRYNFITSTLKVLQKTGTTIARVGWEEEVQTVVQTIPTTEEQIQMTPEGAMSVPVIVGYRTEDIEAPVINRPTAIPKESSNIWYDPGTDDIIENSPFVLERFYLSLNDIKADPSYENVDDLALALESLPIEDPLFADNSINDFVYTDVNKRILTVYEYWGTVDLFNDGNFLPIVCSWVGETIIRLEENPFPDKKHPYVSCAYDPEPNSLEGRPHADVLSTDQRLSTSILRSLMDTLDSSTNGQKGFKEGTLDPVNERRFLHNKNFKYKSDTFNLWEGKYADFNPSILEFYKLNQNNQHEKTGIKPFNDTHSDLGGSGRNLQFNDNDPTSKLQSDISRNYAENFIKRILRKWLSMCYAFMTPEEIERITEQQFVVPDSTDIGSLVDIELQISTPETDSARANDLSFMLQTLGQSLPFDLVKELLAEQTELKRMHGLADRIRKYQQQPDPAEQRLKELEVELKQAEITERLSRARENEVDMRAKTAKAMLDEARAREMNSTADLKDLEFMDKRSGEAYRREEEAKNKEHAVKLQETDSKAAVELAKIGERIGASSSGNTDSNAN